VLVTGAGPIGALVVAALVTAGAGEIVVTDVALPPLDTARAVGATRVIQVGPALDADAAADTTALLDGLEVDVAVESSGTSAGLATCIRAVRRGGRVVSLGLLPPGDSPFPGNLVVTREIELVGAFRFHRELHEVLEALADGRLAAGPVVTHVLPVTDLAEAMPLAGDAARSCKVLLDLDPAPDGGQA
jgi:L-idonate 5-dehydrogenase